MIIIVAVDNRNGLLFNKRRQSQDHILRKKIVEMTAQSHLWMNAYSMKQFSDRTETHLVEDENFLDNAKEGDYCFVENLSVVSYVSKIEQIILYKWNRDYPGDFFFDIPLEPDWKLMEVEEFAGSSHEKITKEIYVHV